MGWIFLNSEEYSWRILCALQMVVAVHFLMQQKSWNTEMDSVVYVLKCLLKQIVRLEYIFWCAKNAVTVLQLNDLSSKTGYQK